ncbi:MAG: aldose 1-epimerase [Pseudomonadota bacterium]
MSGEGPRPISIRAGPLSVGIDPEAGGSLLWFRSVLEGGIQIDWLRPTPEASRDILERACFPLVPFSNRIDGATFSLDTDIVRLQPNWPDGLAIHGFGWQRPWAVAARTDCETALRLDCPADEAWPWQTRSELTYTVSPTALTMRLGLTNLSARPMPSGLGFHPYFPRTEETRLTAPCTGTLLTDPRQIPIALDSAHPVISGLSKGILPDDGFDNALVGWSGLAEVVLSDGHRLVLRADPGTSRAVFYAPVGEPYFCFEPVTHSPNAHNVCLDPSGDSGLVMLEGGETQTFSTALEVAGSV